MAFYNNRKAGVKRSTADIWFSKAVRLRDDSTCQSCKKLGSDCAHIVGRRNNSTRYCAENCLCLCRACHNMYGENPLDFMALISSLYGHDRADYLMVKKRGILKNNDETKKQVSDHYRLEYHRMNKSGDRDLRSFN